MLPKKTSSSAGYRKNVWSAEDDAILLGQVNSIGPMNWNHMASFFPGRTAKQCRERWHNHLTNGIKKGDWRSDEDRTLLMSHSRLGNQWTKISKSLPSRSAGDVKNRYYTLVRERKRGSVKKICKPQLPPHFDLSANSIFDLSNIGTASNSFLTYQNECQNQNKESSDDMQGSYSYRGVNSYQIASGNSSTSRLSSSSARSNTFMEKETVNEKCTKDDEDEDVDDDDDDGDAADEEQDISDIRDYNLRKDMVTFYLFLKDVLQVKNKIPE